jgi:vacuolar-type H+-ATPase subunit I/STV1
VFELKHRDPQQLTPIISMVIQAESQLQAGTVTGTPYAAGYRGVAQPRVAMAANSEEKLLFVRGSEEQVKEIEKLVGALDTEDDQLKPHDVGNYRLVPVRSKDTSQIQSSLSQLNLPGQALNMGEISVVAFRTDDGKDEQRKQAEEVVKKIDARAQDKEKEDKEHKEHKEHRENGNKEG